MSCPKISKLLFIFTLFFLLDPTMMSIFLRVVFFLILVVQLCGAVGNSTNSTNATFPTNSSSYSNVTTPLTTLYIGAFFDLESKNGYGNLPIAQLAIEEVNNNKYILPGYRLELIPISTQVSVH